MKKRNRIIALFTAYSFIVGSIEGYLFYIVHKGYSLNLVSIILMVRSSISSFFLNPNLSLGDAIETCKSYSAAPTVAFFTPFMAKMLLYLYAIAHVVAPLCTASVALIFFESFVRRMKLKYSKRNQPCAIIFGNNATTKKMIQNSQKKHPNQRILLIASEEISKEERLALLRKNIEIVEEDLLSLNEDEIPGFLQKINLPLAKEIFLMEESTTKNFSLYMKLSANGGSTIDKDCVLCCQCEEPSMRKWFVDYYNEHKEECVAPKLFHLSHIRALNVLHHTPLPVKKKNQPIHILIAGLGEMGQELLIETINQSIYSGTNPIIIDAIDYNMNHKKDIFLRRFSSDYASSEANQLVINDTQSDGSLTVNFRNLNISGRKFLDYLNGQSSLDYAVLCIENMDASFACMEGLLEYSRKNAQSSFPIITCLMTDPALTKYINDSRSHENVVVIDSKEYLDINHIVNHSLEESAKDFHKIYNSLNIISELEFKKMQNAPEAIEVTKWENVTQYKQDSSRYVALHQNIVKQMLEDAFGDQVHHQLDAWFGEQGSILQQHGNIYTYCDSLDDTLAKIKATPFLNDFGKSEHRRWMYMNVVRGWSYAPEKDEVGLLSPYMLPWDELYTQYPHMCIYDLMPLLYEHMKKSMA
ncbi:MAG: hypothetical protein MJ087_00150 [Lachnospiraceae bacterium]|nr:hypothetical protein [Lachnospiraceae bacterium]